MSALPLCLGQRSFQHRLSECVFKSLNERDKENRFNLRRFTVTFIQQDTGPQLEMDVKPLSTMTVFSACDCDPCVDFTGMFSVLSALWLP